MHADTLNIVIQPAACGRIVRVGIGPQLYTSETCLQRQAGVQ